MSLKFKSLILFFLSLGTMLAVNYLVVRHMVLRDFGALEAQDMRGELRDAKTIVETMVGEFEQRPEDWSDWDDLAAFVSNGNQEFVHSNLIPNVYEALGWDAVVVVTDSGMRRFSAKLDRSRSSFVAVPAELNRLIDNGVLKPSTGNRSGLRFIDGQLWLVGSRVVRKSDKSPVQDRGWFVFGRIVDSAWMDKYRKFAVLDAAFVPLAQPSPDSEAEAARNALSHGNSDYITKRQGDILAGYTRLNDIVGEPVIDVRLVRPNTLTLAGDHTLGSLTRLLSVSSLLLGIIGMFFTSRFVLRPVSALSAGVSRLRAGERTAVTLPGDDEMAQLAAAFNEMAAKVTDREESMKLILDNIGEGLVITTLTGHIIGQVSASAQRWFGEPAPNTTIWQWLGADPGMTMLFELGYEQIDDGFLPFDVTAEQLPHRMTKGELTYHLDFRPVCDQEGNVCHVLMVIHDVTQQLGQERIEAQARELQLVVANILHDRSGFTQFTKECGALVERICHTKDAKERKRDLHTLKGACSVSGVLSVSRLCHTIEDELADDPGCFGRKHAERLREAWALAMAQVSGYIESEEKVIELSLKEYERFLAEVQSRRDHGKLIRRVKAWKNEPTSKILGRLAAGMRELAQKQQKDIRIEIRDGAVRVDIERMAAFWASMVHVVRNAVDHGIETRAEREASNKSSAAKVLLETEIRDGKLIVRVTDDGRGIDWDKLREKATRQGLTADTQEQLTRAMFAAGVSSKDEPSEVSGRGVGLDAVQHSVEALGGVCRVSSTLGAGTAFEFDIPLPDYELAQMPWSIMPAAS